MLVKPNLGGGLHRVHGGEEDHGEYRKPQTPPEDREARGASLHLLAESVA
jgi:hypothetical protein